tara:strand:+ start:129 stop:467 length:339 start_codon:yes stop_codon:yes gene_type:complete
MKLFLKAQKEKLMKNHIAHKKEWNDENPRSVDFKVVVKLFNPTGVGTWWLTELDPETNIAFGVAQLHEREAGYIDLKELKEFKGVMSLPIERDMYFESNKYTINDILVMTNV